jgi:3-oxoadipate enol-lactonase
VNTTVHQVDSAQLACVSEGAGTPLVMLHGFALDHRMWDDQAQTLSAHYRVLRYDLRGFGRSSLPGDEPYSHTHDLAALLTALDTGPAHVVGLSYGGRCALQFALDHPRAVRSLTLVDSALDGYPWSQSWRALWSSLRRAARSGDVAGARRLWLDNDLFGPARARPDVARRLAQMVDDYSGWHWVHADPETGTVPAAIERLPQLDVRTLVIAGERDLPDFRGVADTLARGIPRAARIVLPGAGHLANMEAPASFNSLLLDFLKAH